MKVDMPLRNIKRAERIEGVLEFYRSIARSEDEDLETVLSDMVADLRHFCRRNGLSMESVLERSMRYFVEESFCGLCGASLGSSDDSDRVPSLCGACRRLQGLKGGGSW